jgi:hypothetical protein
VPKRPNGSNPIAGKPGVYRRGLLATPPAATRQLDPRTRHPTLPRALVIQMTSVEFHFDFGSPNAYLAHRVIPVIEAHTGIQFRYLPVLLGGVFKATNNRSPAETLKGIKNKPEYERLETERFILRHNITNFGGTLLPGQHLQIMYAAVMPKSTGSFRACRGRSATCGRTKKMDDRGDPCGTRRLQLDGAGILQRIRIRGQGTPAATPSSRWRAGPLVRLLSLLARRFSSRTACASSKRRS